MVKHRLVINLAIFGLITLLLTAYTALDLLGNPFSSRLNLYSIFPNDSSIANGFPVTWNGVQIGEVSSVGLVRGGAKVVMSLNQGVRLPRGVEARIGLANDLGEQEVELTSDPSYKDPPYKAQAYKAQPDIYIKNNSRIPLAPDPTPANVGHVVQLATNLINSIPVTSLNRLIGELDVALRGRSEDIKTLINSGQTFADEVLTYQDSLKSLFVNAPPVLNTLNSVRAQLQQSLSNTAILLNVLSTKRYQLIDLLNSGANASSYIDTLLSNEGPNIACLIHDFGGISANLAEPNNLENLNTGLLINQYFFGAIAGVAQTGPAMALSAGEPYNPSQEWLRTRLIVPPSSPQGEPYSVPTGLPAIEPGAGCMTELGSGAGPASQVGFLPFGSRSSPPGQVISPSDTESHVRG